MTHLGYRHLGLGDPGTCSGLIVYVEMDECATAATGAVIGRVPLGLRHLTDGDLLGMTVTLMDVKKDAGVRVGLAGGSTPEETLARLLRPSAIVQGDDGLFTLVDVCAARDPAYVPGRGLARDTAGATPPPEAVQRPPITVAARPGSWLTITGDPVPPPVPLFRTAAPASAAELQTLLLSLGPWPLRAGAGPLAKRHSSAAR
jgi:hypothetical protein